MPVKEFLKKYVIHHFWLGVVMIIEGVILLYNEITIWGFIYLGAGIFFLVDDTLAETKDISIFKLFPSRLQEEDTLNLIGLIFFAIVQFWFFYLIFTIPSNPFNFKIF